MPCFFCLQVPLNEWAVVRAPVSEGTDGQNRMTMPAFKERLESPGGIRTLSDIRSAQHLA